MNHRPPPKGLIRTLTIYRASRLPGQHAARGSVKIGIGHVACALGTIGTTHRKREGDKATPSGRMKILHGFYRPDLMSRPFCRIPLRPLNPTLVWCDDPASPLYNRLHKLPLCATHEVMWRKDCLYDLIFVLDYNVRPRRAGLGSAIFFHCAKPGFPPTLGCVAIRSTDMRRLLPRLARNAVVIVR